MSEKETLVTEEGLRKLQDELDYLITQKRKEVVERIKIARGYGDLSENSEYHAAKDEQAFVETRINQIEAMLRGVKIIDVNEQAKNGVSVGKTVVIQELPDGEEEEYTIVGTTESDPLNGKISNDSPLAQGLMGKEIGDQVSIQTPGGEMKVKVVDIRV
ncbi:transcription elongation factor GreA [Caldalkalibacillus mannanilyticus]|uniref:transcription elongation factor GreA n=1 Tax=Caldalkalibacillus mannanilyticus TaxID=1418 RepID=UPI000469785D|nr:transcription elongation factor GreA [Caldalkalibacillus mannanilyticus]